ncbi:MAG: YncE family protein [Thiohalomonadales bacterium]
MNKTLWSVRQFRNLGLFRRLGLFASLGLLVLLMPALSNAKPLMYVPRGETNDLLIIDLKSDKIVGRIDELENAHGLASNSKTEYLVAGSMQTASGATSSKAAKPAAVSEAEHEAHHAGGAKKPTADGPSFVSIVHARHGHVMNRINVRGLTHHTAVSPDGKTAIAVHSGAGGISVIDLDRMEVTKTLQTGLWPNYAVFAEKRARLYVSNAKPGTVTEIDTKSWTIRREMKVGKEPEHIVLSKDNNVLYTSNKGDGSVSALDLNTGKVRKQYTVGKKAHGLDLSDDGRWLFSASKGANTLTRIDLSSDKSTTINLKPAPYHLAYIPGMNKLYVSSRKLPKIWIIDPETLKMVGEIDLGKGVAHQMVIRNN